MDISSHQSSLSPPRYYQIDSSETNVGGIRGASLRLRRDGLVGCRPVRGQRSATLSISGDANDQDAGRLASPIPAVL